MIIVANGKYKQHLVVSIYVFKQFTLTYFVCIGLICAITCTDDDDDTWNAERSSMVKWLNEMEDSMIDGTSTSLKWWITV